MVKDFYHQRSSAFEERPRPAVFWPASGRAICRVLPFRPSRDSQFVRLFPSLFAAPVGRGGAIAGRFPGRAESGHVPPLVREVVCRMHSKWLKSTRSPLAFLEAGIAMLVLYWVAPATILLFWGRYLTLEDMRGTSALVLLEVGAITAAMGFPRMVGKAFGV